MRETDNIIDVNAVIHAAVSLPLGRTPEERAERVIRALADAGCEIVSKPTGKDLADVARQVEAERQRADAAGLIYGMLVGSDGKVTPLDKEGMQELEAAYVLTPEGEDIIRDLVASTALTQESVTAAKDALEREFDAAPSRFVRHVSGRDHAVSANALAVRDLIEANTLIASAVATLGHEAADLIMQNLITPGVHAAAA